MSRPVAKRGTPGIRKGGLGYCREDKASTPVRPLNPRVSEFEPAVVSIPPCSQPCSEPPSSPSPSWSFQVSPLRSPLPLHQSREATSVAEGLSRGGGGRPFGPSVWTGGMAPWTSSTARMSQPPPATISNNHQDTYNLGNDSKVDPILLGFNTLLFQGIMRIGGASAAMGRMQTSLHGSARKVALQRVAYLGNQPLLQAPTWTTGPVSAPRDTRSTNQLVSGPTASTTSAKPQVCFCTSLWFYVLGSSDMRRPVCQCSNGVTADWSK